MGTGICEHSPVDLDSETNSAHVSAVNTHSTPHVMYILLYVYTIDVVQSDCERFASTCIDLFRQAHDKETTDTSGCRLHVSDSHREAWQQISELWFLGLQGVWRSYMTCNPPRKIPSHFMKNTDCNHALCFQPCVAVYL